MLIETPCLVVRNFRPDDWSDLHEYLSQKEVLKYEPGSASDENDCRNKAAERSKDDTFLAVCLKVTGKMIGHLYFARTEPPEFLTWELGYIFNPAFYGRGHATEACRGILKHAFEKLGAHRIIAMCSPENAPSWRLLERLSMRREGCFRKAAFFRKSEDGKPLWHDGYHYAILNEEWLKHEIIRMLDEYVPNDENEVQYKNQILNFIKSNDIILGKSNENGHLTGSAWVVNKDRSKVLLTHHVILDRWLQLGGHTEENENIVCAAAREAAEESGLSSLKLVTDKIFDVDVHLIPAGNGKKEHYHYDIRFLMEAGDTEKIRVSNESKDVKWIRLGEIGGYTKEESVIRMVRKT